MLGPPRVAGKRNLLPIGDPRGAHLPGAVSAGSCSGGEQCYLRDRQRAGRRTG
jgi:hypothetical protein